GSSSLDHWINTRNRISRTGLQIIKGNTSSGRRAKSEDRPANGVGAGRLFGGVCASPKENHYQERNMRSTMRPTGARAWRRWMSAFGWVMALLVIGAVPAGAQQGARLAPSDTIWEIRLEAGESYVGKVVGIVGDSVTLETATETHIRFPR